MQKDNAIKHRDLKIAQLTHGMATLKRWTFGKGSEQVTGLQKPPRRGDEERACEAIAIELEDLQETPPSAQRPKGIPEARGAAGGTAAG